MTRQVKHIKAGITVAHRNSDSFKIAESDYTITTTPFNFRNYLTLSYDPKFNTQFYIDHSFWVSEVRDMNANDFFGREGNSSGYDNFTNPFQGRNVFFMKYDPRDISNN